MRYARLSLITVTIMVLSVLAVAPASEAERCDPTEPNCHKEFMKKAHCSWTLVGAPQNPATFGARPAAQILTLSCPNHIVLDVEWGVKDCRTPTGITPCQDWQLGDIDVIEGPVVPGLKCDSTRTWEVMAPNLNSYTVWFKAKTWKDANCDGAPDDWNAHWVTPDGREGCYWQNYFGPKLDEHQPQGYPPYWYPPHMPVQDGVVDNCDVQLYEVQWSQWH